MDCRFWRIAFNLFQESQSAHEVIACFKVEMEVAVGQPASDYVRGARGPRLSIRVTITVRRRICRATVAGMIRWIEERAT